MHNRASWIHWSLAGLALTAAASAPATELREEAIEAQRTQAGLQARIDGADQAVRERLQALRQAREETRRLARYNAELSPLVDQQAELLAGRREALATLSETRQALPGLLRDMVERLRQWVAHDMPFLQEERLARVDSLEAMLADPELASDEKLSRVLAAWRSELDYGRGLDAWRGELPGEPPREVDFLRLGRVGWYYLTPDGRRGGVWQAATGDWRPLDEDARGEVRKGLLIVREQRAPELLDLPLSRSVENAS
ncbi:DUF3450 domain-containing protein [Halomonas maura]|uniref:DUF3450 domain-containing protein n=1 Tax=Halomonas maura TaxID=117606 RepID=UPI0025B32947|nr:DUF3450 domain-containing protein [Halomonas maura]MDN3555687.1 DUF3450 domain-containing protein [Halomonas maura]